MPQSTLAKIDAKEDLESARRSTTKRLDIQGLRAVAVLSVVVNHTFGFPIGGFVGVDIFFVISGFVITAMLLREHARSGRISFSDFYKRRVRRIPPASAVVLILTVIFAYVVYLPGRASSILVDGVWSALFAGNWRFAVSGTDYWAQDTPVSPLQHFWSLGVEEQFYFVWPAILVALLGLTAWLRLSPRLSLGAVAGVLAALTILSFVWSVYETAVTPAWSYFSTFSRAWEMGVGALLAVSAGLLNRIPQGLRQPLAYLGVAGVVISMLVVTEGSAFPAPWAALPVFSTALVIAAGTGTGRHIKVLTNPASTYIGDISYSVYLWHFPLIILVGALLPQTDAVFYMTVVAGTAILSFLSYHFVEQPVMNSQWLTRKTGKPPRSRDKKSERPDMRYAGLIGLALVTAVVCVAAFRTTPVEAFPAPQLKPATGETSAPAPTTNQGQLSLQIEQALQAAVWPELAPGADTVLEQGRPDEDSMGCGTTDLFKPTCNFESGKNQSIVVVGDSTGITLLPTVRQALGDTFDIRGMTKAGCNVLDLAVKDDDQNALEACQRFKNDAIGLINELKPDLVILTNTAGVLNTLTSEAKGPAASQEWAAATASTLAKLAPSGSPVVVVAAPPSGKPLAGCATRTSRPQDCAYTIPESYLLAAEASEIATKAAGARFIDSRSWFCNDSGACPAFVGTTPVKRDNVHTTKQYAVTLAPVFKDAIMLATTPQP